METYNGKERKQQKKRRICSYMRVACAEQLNPPEEQMELSQKYAMLNHGVITDIVIGHGVSRLKTIPLYKSFWRLPLRAKSAWLSQNLHVNLVEI